MAADLTGVVIAFLTLVNLLAAGRLVVEILTNNKLFADHPGGLLAAGGVVWTATAISPTDISAIGPWAKLLMMLEAGCSLDRPGRARHRPRD